VLVPSNPVGTPTQAYSFFLTCIWHCL